MNFGKAITDIRHDRKMRQVDLATNANVSIWHLTQIENSRMRPPYDAFERICKALDVAVADVYTLAIEPADFPASRKEQYIYAYRVLRILVKEIINHENNLYA